MINPAKLMRAKGMLQRFSQDHPKFLAFLKAAGADYAAEGTVAEVTLRTPDGRTVHANLRLNAADIAALKELQEIGKG